MPERKCLSNEALNITEDERQALLKVQKMLASKEIHALPKTLAGTCSVSPVKFMAKGGDEGDRYFDMGFWGSPVIEKQNHEHKCGTVGCIGGWMTTFLGEKWGRSAGGVGNISFDRLFYPREIGPRDRWHAITPKQAIKAINNFLETGEPKWKEIVDG